MSSIDRRSFLYGIGSGWKHLDAEGHTTFWANTAKTGGRLLVVCQPGGFEKFFDALDKIPDDKATDAAIKAVMAKYGMDVVGPPLFGLWRNQKSG